jgi:hypothetical protein
MPRGKELRTLEFRRRELVLRSTLNRLAIRVELQNLKSALRPAEQIVSSVRAARPWLVVLAPLAGLFAARGLRGTGSVFSRALGALKWVQSLLLLWKQFRPPAAGQAKEPPPGASAPEAGV